ncbi:Crp/Fnr family transcriptional regulator [Olivibacter sp. SA151]|uniref:Crp/Fnr family transcriptional regulator n=1 Tax=Olivibacter jilunii TaxID=985016 RepID=UPI003F157467
MESITLSVAQDKILQLFNNIFPISDGLSQRIREQSKLALFKKKDHLLRLNETNKSIYFILKGGVRTYYINEHGDDITSWLLFENDLAISVYSFFSQQPSFEAIEALDDCVTLTLSHDALSVLYQQHVEFNYIGRYLTEQYYIRSEAKANSLRMMSATERYLDLLKSQPLLLNRVSLGHVASYLGITQSTLSRIRASI